MSKTLWKPVVGYEGLYEVSSTGFVRSIDRYVKRKGKSGSTVQQRMFGRDLKPSKSSNGYWTYTLSKDNVKKSFCAQYLVLEAFIGARPEGQVVRHLNGRRTDNRLENLCWGTRKENRADADRHGTSVRGEAYSNAKLTDDAVRFIRANRYMISQSQMADKFNVSSAAIQAVLDGRTWTHVQ